VRWYSIVSAVLVSLSACSVSSSSTVRSTAAPGRVRLDLVATLEEPIAMAWRRGDRALYVAERGGRVVAIGEGAPGSRIVLDLTDETEASGEQGLLGLAFSPDGRFLYVDLTDLQGDTRVVEYEMGGERADPASARQLLYVDQPYANHNGGNVVFGPDGFLYVGLGDGGSAGDPHGNGQSLGTLLGSMLRIDPRPSGGEPYRVPADNPFVGRADARPEIWAYGLRNPWRYSFDRATGDLWIADVGQSDLEEIDRQPANSSGGENYGWNAFEGSRVFSGRPVAGTTMPVYEYGHDTGGCAVTGGYVYRGSAIASLTGAYVFTDVCVGELEWLRLEAGGAAHGTLGLTVPSVASFGEDSHGELYVLSLTGPVYRLSARAGAG
jgi:glucose/arabinose dehydrogenase